VSVIPFIVDFNQMERHFPKEKVIVFDKLRLVGFVGVGEGHGSA